MERTPIMLAVVAAAFVLPATDAMPYYSRVNAFGRTFRLLRGDPSPAGMHPLLPIPDHHPEDEPDMETLVNIDEALAKDVGLLRSRPLDAEQRAPPMGAQRTSRFSFAEMESAGIDDALLELVPEEDDPHPTGVGKIIVVGAGGDQLTLTPLQKRVPRKRRQLPSWAKGINKGLGMPMITMADKAHVHALSGALWIFTCYPLITYAWYRELTLDDPTAFPDLSSALLSLCVLAGIATGATGYPLRIKKNFNDYTNQMRNSMMTTAVCVFMCATFAAEPYVETPLLVYSAHAVAAVSVLLILYDAIVTRSPWDITRVVKDLKLQLPPPPAVFASSAISIGWIAMCLAGLAHILLGGSHLTDYGDEITRGTEFAAQMGLALSLGPASEALVGTSMLKDKFTKKAGEHIFVHELPGGYFRPAHWLEVLELIFNVPGPAIISIGLALAAGHGDVVRTFFFL